MEIKLDNIGKRFRYEWIFRHLDYEFSIEDKYAILGPNGSGKSTLMRILSGYLSPNKGSISFFKKGNEIEIGKIYKEVSYAAPYIDLIEELTLTEAIEFHKKFKPFLNNLSTADLIELLNFSKSKHKEIRFFSSGMKQRLKLVLAICSQSSLLLLDEPTTNLDAQGVAWYQDLIHRYGNDRLIIVASNIEHDYDFCTKTINILDYKKRKDQKRAVV